MNEEVYKYVQSTAKKIKDQSSIEDTIQDTMLVLIEKDLHTKPLDDILRNYIKGIVFNVSTRIYNDNIKYVDLDYAKGSSKEADQQNQEYEFHLRKMYSSIKRYVYFNYYRTGKGLNRWRILYLRMKGYSYDEICTRLGIQYYSAIQLFYLCKKELQENSVLLLADCF